MSDELATTTAQDLRKAFLSLLSGEIPPLIRVPEPGENDELREISEAGNALIKSFAEAHDFLSCLSKGTLEIDPPSRNFLISPFKRLHSNLRHLTWQTQQVARGDLSHHVDFLGEFSDAFNSMIDALRDKRRVELQLKLSEERLGLALEAAELGLWDYDIKSGNVIFNEGWAKMLGYASEEVEPTIDFWRRLIHSEDQEAFVTAWEAHLKGLTPSFRLEHRVSAKSGDLKWMLCLGRVVDTGADGNPSRMAGIFVDITDRKEAEAALLDAHASLLDANTKIMDSIHYARTIQTAFLPNEQDIVSELGEYCIIWRPRDVIGGDIYKFKAVPEGFLVAVIDCTGHGVPGAIMTMIAGSSFDRACEDVGHTDPALILRKMNALVKNSLNQHHAETPSDDGLDVGLCFVNKLSKTVTFAGARIDLYIVRDGKLDEIPADRQSVGYKTSRLDFVYKNHQVPIDGHTNFYICTDGILHQTGGPRLFPFGKTRVKKLLAALYGRPLDEHKKALQETIAHYRGSEPQLDDITVFGFSLS
jgi:PAS domain S-box-containing protein